MSSLQKLNEIKQQVKLGRVTPFYIEAVKAILEQEPSCVPFVCDWLKDDTLAVRGCAQSALNQASSHLNTPIYDWFRGEFLASYQSEASEQTRHRTLHMAARVLQARGETEHCLLIQQYAFENNDTWVGVRAVGLASLLPENDSTERIVECMNKLKNAGLEENRGSCVFFVLFVSLMSVLLSGHPLTYVLAFLVAAYTLTTVVSSVLFNVPKINQVKGAYIKAAIKALGEIGDVRSIRPLIDYLRIPFFKDESTQALMALFAKLDEANSLMLTTNETNSLILGLIHQSEPHQLALARALRFLADANIIPFLKQFAQKHPAGLLSQTLNETIAHLQAKLEKQNQQRSLLRAAENVEQQSLLQAAKAPDELPQEQLLRPQNENNP